LIPTFGGVPSTEFEQNKIKVLLVGNSHGKDMFNAFFQNKELFHDYDFMYYNIQISCFDDKNNQNKKSAKAFYSSNRYKQTDIVAVSTRYDIDPCHRSQRNRKESSDLYGLQDLIEKVKSDEKGMIIYGNSTEYDYQNGRLISDDYFLGLLEDEKLAHTMLDRKKYRNMVDRINNTYYKKKFRKASLNEKVHTIAKKNGVSYFDKFELTCDKKREICFGITPSGYKSFYDATHFTLEGAKFFGERMAQLGMIELLKDVSSVARRRVLAQN